MRQIRQGVFETNSSSVHSLSIVSNDNVLKPTVIHGYFGEFGWGYDKYDSPEGRLSYVLTNLADLCFANNYSSDRSFEETKLKLLNFKYFKWLDDAILQHTGNHILFEWGDLEASNSWYKFGYIDHQSADIEEAEGGGYIANILIDFWSENKKDFQKNMIYFIFNNKYLIIIDNDNR